MSIRAIYIAAGLAGGLALQVQAADFKMDPALQSELAKYGDVVTPPSRGREFEMFNLGINTGVNLGCNGINGVNALETLGTEMQGFADYIKNNWAGLAMNYLIYSNPTLYSIFENINIHREFLRSLNVASCASVRAAATNQRERENVEKAKAACMTAKNSVENCQDADALREFMDTDVVEKWLDELDNAGFKNGSLSGLPTSIDKEDSRKDPEDPMDVGKTLKSLLDEIVIDRTTGGQTFVPRGTTVAAVFKKRYDYYAKLYTDIGLGPNGSADRASRLLSTDRGGKPDSADTYAKLSKLRQSSPANFGGAVSLLARARAHAWILYVATWGRTEYLYSLSSAAGKVLTDQELAQIMRQIESLVAEVDLYIRQDSMGQRQGELERLLGSN